MCDHHGPPNPTFDIKIRSWGPSGLYGISPLSESGLRWAKVWLKEQSFFYGIEDDGAYLFFDQFRDQVAKSALSHELTASAGVGPQPSEGQAFDLSDWISPE